MLEVVLFYISLIGVTYSYFIYPFLLLILLKFKKEELLNQNIDSKPPLLISFIITAYNEESSIAEKINNTLLSDYPKDQLEILVASDGSSDQTNNIVKSFESKGVKLIDVTERLGKENAQKQAIQAATGDIIVFSDVSTRIEASALELISNVFQDESIGALSSEDRFISQDGSVVGEGAYVKYEMWLRSLESRFNSLVGLSGSFFAARKSVCQTWDISVPSDFNTALNSVSLGYKAISDSKLLGFYPDIKSNDKEYQRKLRTVIRGMAALFSKTEVLNPFKYGIFSFQIISHKLMRWLVPWFLITSFILNMFLFDQGILFKVTMAGQLALYFAAATGWLIKSSQSIALIKICFFFIQVNLAILHATLMFASGRRITKWEPSKR